jgi:hypothetical protein
MPTRSSKRSNPPTSEVTGVESAFAGARGDAVVAGTAALSTVALALLGRPTLYTLAPLFVYFAFRLGGHRLVERPALWAALTVAVGVVVALAQRYAMSRLVSMLTDSVRFSLIVSSSALPPRNFGTARRFSISAPSMEVWRSKTTSAMCVV